MPAHLTLFHALPPGDEAEVRQVLGRACAAGAPQARVSGLTDLGGGVAVRVRSEALDDIRAGMVDHFHGRLTLQDSSGWVPQVTIQNKTERGVVRQLLRDLENEIEQRPLTIRGLLLFRYLGGPWEPLGTHRFRGA